MLKKLVAIFVALLLVGFVGVSDVRAEQSGPTLPEGAVKVLPSKITGPSGQVVFHEASAPRGSAARPDSSVSLPDKPERGLYTTLESKGARLGLYGFETFRPVRDELWVDGQKIAVDPNGTKPTVSYSDPSIISDPKGFRKWWSKDTDKVLKVGVYLLQVRAFVDARRYWAFDFNVKVESFQFYLSSICVQDSVIQLGYWINTVGKVPNGVAIEIPDVLSGLATVKKMGTNSGFVTLPVGTNAYEEFLSGQKLETTIKDASNYKRGGTSFVYYPKVQYLGSCDGSGGGGGGMG